MSYWRNRLKEEEEKAKQRDFDRQLELERIYQTANDNIERDVRTFFDRYASRKGISPAQARRRADVTDLNILSNKAEQYVADKDFSDEANMMLRNYNLKGRVTREELLKHRVGMAMHELGYNEEQYMKSVYNDEIHRQMEINAGIWEMTVPEVDTLKAMTETIINKPFFGDTWSNRIWKRQDVVAKYMNDNISKAIIQGKNATTLVNELRSLTGRSSREAKRLLVTETARMQSETQRELMQHNGYETYEYIAESTACEICAELDGEIFGVEEMETGVNSAPMHPFCRCATAPSAEFERSQLERMLGD